MLKRFKWPKQYKIDNLRMIERINQFVRLKRPSSLSLISIHWSVVIGVLLFIAGVKKFGRRFFFQMQNIMFLTGTTKQHFAFYSALFLFSSKRLKYICK